MDCEIQPGLVNINLSRTTDLGYGSCSAHDSFKCILPFKGNAVFASMNIILNHQAVKFYLETNHLPTAYGNRCAANVCSDAPNSRLRSPRADLFELSYAARNLPSLTWWVAWESKLLQVEGSLAGRSRIGLFCRISVVLTSGSVQCLFASIIRTPQPRAQSSRSL